MLKYRAARQTLYHMLVALTSTLVLLLSNVLSASPALAVAPVRVMAIGDSITAGDDGDFTWRYRLAQHFAQTSASVDMVGDYTAPRQGTYAVDGWDMDHQAVWGMPAWEQKTVTQAAVARHNPDYIVLHIGTNDLAFGGTPVAAADDVHAIIDAARAGRASIKILLMEIIPRLGTDDATTNDYNSRLAALANAVTTAESPVMVAHNYAGFDSRVDLYDGTHPNRIGEYKLAAAVAGGLWRTFGVGADYGAIPNVASGPDAPTGVSASSEDGAALITWSPVRQATSYNVYSRNLSNGETSFKLVQFGITETSWRHNLLVNGQQIEYHVTAARSYDESPQSTNIQVIPSAPRPAIPTNVGTSTSGNCEPRRNSPCLIFF